HRRGERGLGAFSGGSREKKGLEIHHFRKFIVGPGLGALEVGEVEAGGGITGLGGGRGGWGAAGRGGHLTGPALDSYRPGSKSLRGALLGHAAQPAPESGRHRRQGYRGCGVRPRGYQGQGAWYLRGRAVRRPNAQQGSALLVTLWLVQGAPS